MSKILIVVGTRPNFIKITQFKKENEELGNPFEIKIVHTGQHYDEKMAAVFFQQFELVPDYFLNIPVASANKQMAEIMIRLEEVIEKYNPDLIMVAGDVNSTFAAALAANKLNIRIAHIESGLRSFDRGMPEEINRILTDEITDYFFVTEQSGIDNLLKEGKNKENIFFVKLEKDGYALMTMHRPATVDFEEGLQKLIDIIEFITKDQFLIFPIHPRTTAKLKSYGLLEGIESNKKVILTEPMDYFSFQKLCSDCNFVITDSGGIQEETTFRKIPCLTLRPNTERPSTIEIGTNELVPFEVNEVKSKIEDIVGGTFKQGDLPPLWDGNSTRRILESCMAIFSEDLEKKKSYSI